MIRIDGSKLFKNGLLVAELTGELTSRGRKVASFRNNTIFDASGTKIGSIHGDNILDGFGHIIGSLKELKNVIPGATGIGAAAIWLLFIR